MCGIAGKFYFNKEKAVEPDLIKEMTKAIAHRGPDNEGYYINKNIGLGHRRLSIIDLSESGNQPMSDNEKRIWMVFNGEIYNFLELRKELEKDGVSFSSKSDTEVIIYLYKKYGASCLKYLRGMFAFAIWDENKQQLFLARDRIGKKPLKYFFDNNCFIFSSELKAIIKDKAVKKEVDFGAIDEYLTYQYVPQPKTGFKNIYKLEPAHYLIVDKNGKIKKERYWQLDFSQKLDLTKDEWQEKITNKLQESVKLRLMSDVPLGAHLSGGVDSSLIVALMARESKNRIKTFSIGFKEDDYNELPFAKMVAKRYNTDHQEFIMEPDAIKILPKMVYHYEEPYADSSALPSWYLSEITKKYVTVALNGDGGDENFAGYNRYYAAKLHALMKLVPFKPFFKKTADICYHFSKLKTAKKFGKLLNLKTNSYPDFYLSLINYFGQEDKGLIYTDSMKERAVNSRWSSFLENIFKEAANFDSIDKLLYADINAGLPSDLLVKVDIASMAHALEIRCPFLDYEFMELTAKIPSNLKMTGFDKKHLLKNIAEDFIPMECVKKPKQGFSIPLEYWFRNDLNPLLKERLLDNSFLEFGFEKEGVEKMIQEHKDFRQDQSYRLWTLLTLSYWLEEFFVKSPK